jgi:hypothetical protein
VAFVFLNLASLNMMSSNCIHLSSEHMVSFLWLNKTSYIDIYFFFSIHSHRASSGMFP